MNEERTAEAMEFAESLFLPASRDANEPHETKVKRIASRVQSLLNQRESELEALQKANSYMADQLQQSAYVSKDNLALRTQNQELREALREGVDCIGKLSEQQAMPDNFYEPTLNRLNQALATKP